MAPAPQRCSVSDALAGLRFLADRTPTTTDAEAVDAFAVVTGYRDGGVFVGHWAGSSEWERHPVDDELVMVLEGSTTIHLLDDGDEHSTELGPDDLVVVPRGVWHRFETPVGVKLLSVTPQPTEHSAALPR
ncbi:MAG: cupin domain-containing protein [Microthrixaceae bacterium]